MKKLILTTLLLSTFYLTGCNLPTYNKETSQNKPVEEKSTVATKVDERVQLNFKYTKDSEHVYFYEDAMGGGSWSVLEDADPSSFEIILEILDQSMEKSLFAKDKNYVFEDGKKLEGVSSEKFEFIYGSGNRARYAKDKKNVYMLYSDMITPYERFRILKGADPDSFIFFDHKNCHSIAAKYSKDIRNAYFGATQIEEADGASFEHVALDLAKDKNYVYFLGGKVPGADSATIEYVPDTDNSCSTTYFKDVNFVYKCFNSCEILEDMDPNTFKP